VQASSSIQWPGRFRPDRAPVHVRNEIDIPASPAQVWPWLIRAPLWPTWYPNSSEVRLVGGATELALGTEFRWRTFGASLRSTVEEFVPPERLAWSARGTGVEVYHAWLITAIPTGCHVLTEESQYGILARLDHLLRPLRMGAGHDDWLRRLGEKALGGPPPPP
jgi:uncharacterized protein YndB with AHSA1/START domain